MQETILVEKDGRGFYAPAEEARRWSDEGYAVYRIDVVPVNSAAKSGRNIAMAPNRPAVAPPNKTEEIR